MFVKTSVLELPETIAGVVGLVARLMTNDLIKVTLNFTGNTVDVRWNANENEELDESDPMDVEVEDLFNRIRISESDVGAETDLNPSHISRIANALLVLAADRKFLVGWACTNAEHLKQWLRVPAAVPLTTLLGAPVYSYDAEDTADLFALGSKFYGAPLKSVSVIQKVSMSEVGK